VYHVLDPDTGQAINSTQFTNGSVNGSTLGGLFSDSGVAGGVVFANGNSYPGNQGGGVLVAFKADNAGNPTLLWTFKPNGFFSVSGVGLANGVVYYTTAMDPNLYALDAGTGNVLNAIPIGASNSGPSISQGRVYVGTGSVFLGGFQIPGSITCLAPTNP
jgi:outer membrane protein assembly factor BamB